MEIDQASQRYVRRLFVRCRLAVVLSTEALTGLLYTLKKENPELDDQLKAHRRLHATSRYERKKKKTLVVIAKHPYSATSSKELSFKKGERMLVAEPVPEKKWWLVSLAVAIIMLNF